MLALHAFEAGEDNEISFSIGEIITVIDDRSTDQIIKYLPYIYLPIFKTLVTNFGGAEQMQKAKPAIFPQISSHWI